MAKEIGKDANAQEDAAKAKYTFRDIYDKVPHKTYSAHADETTSSEHSKSQSSVSQQMMGDFNERECTNAIWVIGTIPTK